MRTLRGVRDDDGSAVISARVVPAFGEDVESKDSVACMFGHSRTRLKPENRYSRNVVYKSRLLNSLIRRMT